MRADIAAREKAQAMHVTATLAMTDEWTDASASAVAVYRPGKTPENVIFLPPNATPGNVAAGIRALSALRKRETSTNRESRLVAHERSIPDSWKADRTDRVMLEYLSDLSSQPTATITGQVRARTLQLPIRLK